MGENIQKIDFSCVVAAGSDPKLFLSSLVRHDGWAVAPPKFPTDVVLSLGGKFNVYKVTLESHQDFIPTKIEIHVGRCNWGDFEPTAECAERASFTRRGTVEFYPKGAGNLTNDPQNYYTDSIGQFVWLVIHENHQGPQNPENFIGLKNITILGYPIEKVQSSQQSATNQEVEDYPQDPTMSSRRDVDDEYDEYRDRRSNNKEYRSVSRARSAASRVTRSSSAKSKRSYVDKSGYSQRNEELGEDPLTSVRTLRNVLRKKRIAAEQDDKAVEASMCRRGCERLDEAEDDIMELKKKHSNALIHSDTTAADQHRQAMCDVRDSAFRAIHADLLLDRSELRTFGVKSKWGQDPSEKDSRRRAPSSDGRRAPSSDGRRAASESGKRFVPRDEVPIVLSRGVSGRRSPEGNQKPSWNSSPSTYDHSVKRNERLAEREAREGRGGAPYHPPDPRPTYQPSSVPTQATATAPASGTNQCPFCDEANGEFAREGRLNSHFADYCPMLSRCKFCDRAVEVQKLNDHWLSGRCPFLNNSLIPCPKCGQACAEIDLQNNGDHINCRQVKPPLGGDWCPLCGVAVTPMHSKAAWKQHLVGGCYDNPRRHLSGAGPPGAERPTKVKNHRRKFFRH